MSVRQKVLFLLLGLLTGVALTTVWGVVAQPVPGSGKTQIPYQGVLQQDGVPVNASGDQALSITYKFFDGPGEGASEIYSQTLATEVFQGRFTVGIGPTDDQGRSVSEMVRDFDDIYLGMVIGDVVMANRQKVLATPYSMATSSASDFAVTGDAQVGGDLDVGGSVAIGGDITQVGTITTVTLNGGTVNTTTFNAQGATISSLTAPALQSTNLTATNINTNNLIAQNIGIDGAAELTHQTEDFNALRAAALRPVATHFCALTQVRFGDDNDEDDTSRCIVYNNGGTWTLEIRTTSDEAQSACSATCLRYR